LSPPRRTPPVTSYLEEFVETNSEKVRGLVDCKKIIEEEYLSR
jgi:hypothetical protein